MKKLFLLVLFSAFVWVHPLMAQTPSGAYSSPSTGANLASPGSLCATMPCSLNATTVTASGAITDTADGVHAGYINWVGNTANFAVTANTVGFMGPNVATFTAYAIQFASVIPVTNDLFSCVVTSTICALTDSGASATGGNFYESTKILSGNQVKAGVVGGLSDTNATAGLVSTGGIVASNLTYCWSSSSDIDAAGCDTAFSRDSAGVVDVGTGVAGSKVGKIRAALYSADGGTACTNGELALSANWAATGSSSVTTAAGTGQTCEWTITTGTTTGANPTVTDTLTNTLPSASTVCWMIITGGTRTAAASDSFDQTTLSATAPIFTFQGTPTAAGKTYKVVRTCGP